MRQEVPGDSLCPHLGNGRGSGTEGSRQRCPGTGTFPPPPGPEQKPHKGTLSAGTRGLCARPSVPPVSAIPASPAPSCGCRCPGDTALSRLTGALFAAAGDKLCWGWAQTAQFWGQTHAHAAKNLNNPSSLEQPLKIPPVKGRGSKTHCEGCIKKNRKPKTLKTPRRLFRLPCASRRAGRAAWPGHAVHPGQGLARSRQARLQKKRGIFLVAFSFAFGKSQACNHAPRSALHGNGRLLASF